MFKKPTDAAATLATLKKADKAYFNSGKPIMTDAEYDKLRDALAKTKITDKKLAAEVKKYLASTGTEETSGEKVDLPFYLPSLDKIKTDEPKAFDKFVERTVKAGAVQFIVGPKFDGSSFLLQYVNGAFKDAFTRGNGNVGRRVTKHARKLIEAGRVPAKIDQKGTIYIRCELCITRKAFKKWEGKTVGGRTYNEARNAVNGFLTAKSFDADFTKVLSVVAFDLMDAKGNAVLDTKLTAVKWLAAQGFSDMFAKNYKLVKGDAVKTALDAMLKAVSSPSYEIECDGVVVEANLATVRTSLRKGREDRRPYFAMAYKYGVTEDATAQITTVRKLVWTAGADGARIPNVEYDPIKVGKTELSAASAHNAKNIVDLNLGVGAKVKIVRSGGVIPHVVEVTKVGTKAKLPTKCDCGAKLVMGDAHLYCSKPDKCPQTMLARLEKAANHLGIDGLGASGFAKLYDAGITTILKLFNAPKPKLQKVLGNAAGAKVHASAQEWRSELEVADIMVVSGAFIRPGMSIAGKGAEKVAKALGKSILNYAGKPNALTKKLIVVPGIGAETVKLFVDGYPKFCAFYNAVKE